MKTLIMLSSAIAIAGFVTLLQQLTAQTGDEFQVVQYGGADHKVFSYGFPFRVADTDGALPGEALPSLRQTTVRKVGNFMFFAAVSLAALQLVWLICSRLQSWHQIRMYARHS